MTAVVTDLESPNGLAFSPDESILYADNTRRDDECAAEKERGKVCTHQYIRAYDVAPDGSVSNSRLFANMHSVEDGVPDGMKVDTDGRVYCTGAGGVWVFEPDGSLVGIIRLPEIPANCAWGDADCRTMYFTARSSVYRLRMKTTGINPWRGRLTGPLAGAPGGCKGGSHLMAGRDLIGYGPNSPVVEWPNGARIAVSFVVNYEEGSENSILDGDPHGETVGESPSPVARGERDLANESFFEYGSRVGVWRVLDLLDEYGFDSTFFACALALERNPAVGAGGRPPGARGNGSRQPMGKILQDGPGG